uniref:J domain-containing protein n=1 Tax=Mucochytrium quahogii TaxID=96639 RepID=A0A7S2W404_9STRA|mmetsp:Transcript_24976/g.40525  ORF Transcript_24976/g.40525 Transcript_24976/m.40525 type:complete len:864 (+) Transcript_24976:197-2788(+)
MASQAARLRALASEIEMNDRTRRECINELNDEIRMIRSSRGRLEDELQECQEEKAELEKEKAEMRVRLEKAEAEAKLYAQGYAHEIVSLRFELATAKQELRKMVRSKELADIVNSNDDCSERLALFTPPEADDDADLILPNVFVNAAKRGLGCVLRNVLKPEVNKDRAARFKDMLGNAMLEVCSSGGAALSETVKLLIEHGADVNAKKPKDEGGRSVLHILSAKGNKELVDQILQVPGVDIEPLDAHGRTPLHLAARLRKVDAAKALLQKGADPNLKTPDGKSPKDMAYDSSESSFSLSFTSMNIKQVFDNPSVMFWNGSTLALRHYKKGNWQDAYDNFSRSVDLAEKHPRITSKANLARLRYNRAKVCKVLGELCTALEDCNVALELDQSYTNALEVRAFCHMSMFDFERAANDFKVLVETGVETDKEYWGNQLEEAIQARDCSHYHILGIPKHATAARIKKAFRTESIKWHPDKHYGSKEDTHRARIHFQRINEARETLMNGNRRTIYDSEQRFKDQRKYFFDSYEFEDDESSDEEVHYDSLPWNIPGTSQPLYEQKLQYKRKKEKEKEEKEKKDREEEEEREKLEQEKRRQADAAQGDSPERQQEENPPPVTRPVSPPQETSEQDNTSPVVAAATPPDIPQDTADDEEEPACGSDSEHDTSSNDGNGEELDDESDYIERLNRRFGTFGYEENDDQEDDENDDEDQDLADAFKDYVHMTSLMEKLGLSDLYNTKRQDEYDAESGEETYEDDEEEQSDEVSDEGSEETSLERERRMALERASLRLQKAKLAATNMQAQLNAKLAGHGDSSEDQGKQSAAVEGQDQTKSIPPFEEAKDCTEAFLPQTNSKTKRNRNRRRKGKR